jgi:dihydrofolate reductase
VDPRERHDEFPPRRRSPLATHTTEDNSTLKAPLSWANTELVAGDAVEAVRDLKRSSSRPLRTIGSLSLCRSLLAAGLVDRFRVVAFPVITGATGRERIFDGYPGVGG